MNQIPYAVLILNKHPLIARNFLASIKKYHVFMPSILFVLDNHTEEIEPGLMHLTSDRPFVYSRNVNMGFEHLKGFDIILCNDDLECVEENFFPKLADTANRVSKAGMVSPLIDGGVGQKMQIYPEQKCWSIIPDGLWANMHALSFHCVYIKRNLIDTIGLMDESFVGYGLDDDDYCIRARQAGFMLTIDRNIHIKHGDGGVVPIRGKNWSKTFDHNVKSNLSLFVEKHKGVLGEMVS